MSCTKEEIERKRLAALQRRNNNNVSTNLSAVYPSNECRFSKAGPSHAGPLRDANCYQKKFHPYLNPEGKKYNSEKTNSVPVGKVISGTVYLISEERFEVNPSDFCTPLIDIFKTIPSKSFDVKSKLWNFSINDYEQLISKVSPLAPHVVLGSLPAYVLKVLREEIIDPNKIDLSPIEVTLRHKLMPFQEDGVRFAIARQGRCLIADDMGLGKTFQALAIASYYRHNWPLLIVTTSSMRETWQSKIHELLPSVPLMNIATLTTSKDTQLVADKQTEVVIVSYKITSMHTEVLKSKKFGMVIIDESHHLKSHKARCTVALGGVTRGCSRVVLLSGTPALSRPAELYTQLALIEPKLFGSYTEYGKRYCDGKQTNFGWDMSGQSNLAELQVVLQRRFLIRRTKEQVLTTLEEKTRETVYLEASLLQGGQSALGRLQAACRRPGAERHAALLSYYSETARLKIPAICKYVKELVEEAEAEGEKFLVFAHHRNVIEAVCLTLDEARVNYISIVGATPPHARAELVEKFQHWARCRGGVMSLTAAGAGVTLTAAGLVVFAELHWNPGVLVQAECRAHRMGRAGRVRVRYLHAARTADDIMWPMLQDKLHVLNDVGLSKDTLEDTATRHQESEENKSNITQYLLPRNSNDFIPGTNIRKNSVKSGTNREYATLNTKSDDSDVVDKSFLEDDEGDELLATLDL